jgi:hypothetical protein
MGPALRCSHGDYLREPGRPATLTSAHLPTTAGSQAVLRQMAAFKRLPGSYQSNSTLARYVHCGLEQIVHGLLCIPAAAVSAFASGTRLGRRSCLYSGFCDADALSQHSFASVMHLYRMGSRARHHVVTRAVAGDPDFASGQAVAQDSTLTITLPLTSLLALRSCDRTSSNASEHGFVTQSPDTGAWIALTSAGPNSPHGVRGGACTPTGYPFVEGASAFPVRALGGEGAPSALASLAACSPRTDRWMLPSVPATDGIQLPELPPTFEHASAPEFPMLADDDTALFDALYGV